MLKNVAALLSNKVNDSDANHSVKVDSYESAKDLQPQYDPLSLRREKTITDQNLSESSFNKFEKFEKTIPVRKATFEKKAEAAGRKLASFLDVDSLEKKFEDIFGYKVSITPSKQAESLHGKAQKHHETLEAGSKDD